MANAWADWVTRHAGGVVAIVLLLTVAAGATLFDWSSGEFRVRIDARVADLLPIDADERRQFEDAARLFGRSEAVVVAVYNENMFAPDTLRALAQLTEHVRTLSFVYRVVSLATVPFPQAGEGNEVNFSSLAERADREDFDRDALRDAARSDPLYGDMLLSGTGDATAMLVYLKPSYESDPGTEASVARIRGLASETMPSSMLRLAGPPAIKAATGDALVNTLSYVMPGILLLVVVVLTLAFRSVRGVLLPLLNIGVVLVWVLALLVQFGGTLNLITSIMPPLLITIALAYALHVLSAVYRTAVSTEDCVRDALTDMTLPLAMTGLTTAAGFFALSLSPLEPVRVFSGLSGVGVLLAALLSLTFLPALLELTGCRTMTPPPGIRIFRRWAHQIGRFDVRYRRPILAVGVGVMIVSVLGTLLIHVGTDYVRGFPEDAPVRVDYETINRDFGGATPLSIVLESPEADVFSRPETLHAMQDLQEWLGRQPEIGGVSSLVDYLKTLNRALHGGDSEHFVIPERQAMVKQILLFGGGDTLESFVDSQYRHTHMMVRASVSESAAIGALVQRIEQRLAKLPAPISGYVTGTPVMINSAVDAIAGGQVRTIGAALLVVLGLLAALFTSFRVGLLALLPNLLPVLFYFGLLGFSGVTLNPTPSLIACIVLGIAVDDTLYYLARFNTDARRYANERRATVSALRVVIRPVTYTSLALVAGFLVLASSELQNQAQFGMLAALTIVVAWLADVFFTPALVSGVRIVTLWDVLRLDLGREPQRSIPLFHDLSLRQARIFALLSKIEHFRAGQRVMSEGDQAGDIYVVIDGELRAWVRREDEEVELSRVQRGAVLGEVGHFAERRTANVDAVTDARLLRFDSLDLERLRRRYPRTAALVFRNLNRIQAKRLAETTQMLR